MRFSLSLMLWVSCLSLAAQPALGQLPGFEQLRSRHAAAPVDPGALTAGDLVASGLDLEMLGGVPQGEATAEPMRLSITDALRLGLERNLGLLMRNQELRRAGGRVDRERADLLPRLTAEIAHRSQQFNFEASPFSRFRPPGAGSEAVVDFESVDARLFLSATLFDLAESAELRAARSRYRAAESTVREMRNLVALFVGNLYLRSLIAEVQARAMDAQEATALGLYDLAVGHYNSGLISQVDALRAEVQKERERQRAILAKNALEKSKLRLARAIGLPIGQRILLTDNLSFVPVTGLDFDSALERARAERPDLERARAEVEAARAELRAASADRLPSLSLEADFGELGTDFDNTRTTFNVETRLSLPIFEGGRSASLRAEKRSGLVRVEARLADLEAQAYYQLREAFLDVEASEQNVLSAQRAMALAERQLEQSSDRFSAGVTDHLEVVAAQESLAAERLAEINALLSHRLAKGALARALGIDEETILEVLSREAIGRDSASDPETPGRSQKGARR